MLRHGSVVGVVHSKLSRTDHALAVASIMSAVPVRLMRIRSGRMPTAAERQRESPGISGMLPQSPGGSRGMRRAITKYAQSGSALIAYQVIGQGSLDLVLVPAFPCNLEILPEDPGYSHLLQRLPRCCRLVVFDPRGSGLSDGFDPTGPLDSETRVADILSIMDAVGAGRTALLGATDGAAQAMLFAALHSARCGRRFCRRRGGSGLTPFPYGFMPCVRSRRCRAP